MAFDAFTDKNAVIDNGTWYTKMGFVGNVEPCFITPTVVAVNNSFSAQAPAAKGAAKGNWLVQQNDGVIGTTMRRTSQRRRCSPLIGHRERDVERCKPKLLHYHSLSDNQSEMNQREVSRIWHVAPLNIRLENQMNLPLLGIHRKAQNVDEGLLSNTHMSIRRCCPVRVLHEATPYLCIEILNVYVADALVSPCGTGRCSFSSLSLLLCKLALVFTC